MEHFMALYSVLSEFFGPSHVPNSAELMAIYGRMCVNSFNICDSELRCLGTGIYLAASVLDHSCQPNAVALFQGTTLHVRVTETIPQLDWSKIFISYIDTINTTKTRREELESTYYFLCQCPLCVDNQMQRTMRSAACPNYSCNGQIDVFSQPADIITCPECETAVSDSFLEEYNEVVDLTDMHLQKMKQTAYLDVCKVCLKKQKGILHDLNIQHVKTLDLAFDSSIDFGQWDEAVTYGVELIPGYIKYLGHIHPLLGILYLKIGKILMFQAKSLEALKYLNEANTILSVTHGRDNVIFKNELLPLLKQATMETSLC